MQHLFRQQRCGRVRDGVVSVNDVEIELASDLHDGICQRKQVLRFTEERIRRRLDLMKRKVRMKLVEPERCIAAHQMHSMAG